MKGRGGILLVLFIFVMFIVAILFTSPPTNWDYTYTKYSKNPHGSYMLFEELDEIFPNAEIIVGDTTITSILENWDKPNTAYIFIGETDLSVKYEKGNEVTLIKNFLKNDSLSNRHVFIAKEYLNIKGRVLHSYKSEIKSLSVNEEGYYSQSYEKSYLRLRQNSRIDSTTTQYASRYFLAKNQDYVPLGMLNDTVTNFIKIPFENNNSLLLHTSPKVFTNYAMLNEGLADYVAETLSHMENIEYVIWDENYKPNMSFMGREKVEKKSILYLVNDNRALYIAKILTILGCLLLLFTFIKRRQQAIPIVEPPSNKSVEFVSNMGKLYHEKADHKDLSQKKMEYFEFELRRKFKISNIDTYKKKVDQLATITGYQEDDLNEYFKMKQVIEQNPQVEEIRLVQLSNAIENLKKNQV